MYVEWDVKTITAGDYTVEFDIKPEFFTKWIKTQYTKFCAKQNREKGISYTAMVEAFRDWFQQEMEARLSDMPDLGYEDQPVEHIKIAVTTFAFRNADMIHLLTQRGDLIKAEKWDKMAEMDKKINDLKNNDLNKLTTPCSVFMTFEDEEGVNRALQYDDAIKLDPDNLDKYKTWLDEFEIEV